MSITRFFARIFILPYLMRDAAIAFQKDNYLEAIKIYLKVIEVHPMFYDAHLWAGTAYSAIDQNIKAIECYEKAIKINIKGYDAYYNYAQLELKQNKYENSLRLIIKAIEYTPFQADNFSNLYYRKGLLEYYLFHYQEALQSFNKSLEYKPSNTHAQNGRTIAAEGILSDYKISN